MASLDADSQATTSTESDEANIKVTAVRAAVLWTDDIGETCSLIQEPGCGPVTCDVHFNSSSNEALFRLRAGVALKVRRDRQHIYVFIHPERIRTLVLDQDPPVNTAQENLGTVSYCLCLHLTDPPDIVGPKDERLVPKNNASQNMLKSLQALGNVTSLSIYLPMTCVSKSQLTSLCESASIGGRLSTIKELANIGRLYGGRGGKILQSDKQDDVEPPPYQEPPPQPQYSGRKRPRGNSSPRHGDQVSMEKMCNQIMARMDQGFSEMRNYIQSIEHRVDRLESRMETWMTRVAGRSSEMADELRDEFESGLSDVKSEVTNAFESMHEDRMYAAQKELQEFVEDRLDDVVNERLCEAAETLGEHVNDEMRDAEERVEQGIRERLSTANFSIQWTQGST